MARLRFMLAAALLPCCASRSISELSWYQPTEQIAASLSNLSLACNLTLNPEISGVDWDATGVNGVLFSRGGASRKKRGFLLNFASHARDYALPDLALRLVRKLCDGSHRSREIVGAHDILIIPLLNVRGRKRVESELDSSSCADLSKNGNLVDINANFDVGWTYASANPSAADYRGPLAAQEEETKLLKALGSTWGPRVFIDVQSADSSALAHARWSSVAAPDQLDKLNSCVDQVARHTAGLCQNNSYPGTNECPKVGSASMATLPPGKLFGTALDWFDSQEGVLAFLFSTFSGSQSAASHITHAPTTTRLSQVGENGLSSLVRQQRSAESTSRVNRSTAATQARLLAELKPQSEAVLLLEGELARGALYDPIDDCIKYYTPISEIEYEQMVDRWLEAFYSTFEHFSDENNFARETPATSQLSSENSENSASESAS